MGQQRVSHIALISSEGECANSVVGSDIERIIDIFGPWKWQRQLFLKRVL